MFDTKLYSSYWLKEDYSTHEKLIQLSQYRRAIAKFVNISTSSAGKFNKNIKVKFNVQDHSYTDLKNVVVISSQINNDEFDVAAGLALHESNHIIDTEPISIRYINDANVLINKGLEKGISQEETLDYINSLRNWIEDRRIDQKAWDRSPGYKPYYDSLYKKYFGNEMITKGLLSKTYAREVDIDSYMYRIINSLNPASDPSALPSLDTILDLLTMPKMKALKSNLESCLLAITVFDIILNELPDVSSDESESGTDSSDESGEGEESKDSQDGSGSGSGTDSSDLPDDMVNENPSQAGGSSDEKTDQKSDEKSDDKSKKKTPTEKKIDKAYKEALDLVNQTLDKKSNLDDYDVEQLESIETSNATIKQIDGRSVIVIKKVTPSLFDKYPLLLKHPYSQSITDNGIALGKKLVKKLQIRTDVKTYNFKRRTAGKIDKRLLHSVGFGDTSIFEQLKIDKFTDALVHLSIDGSSSMVGNRWDKTFTAATAIAYSATKIKGFDVVLTVRGTTSNTPLMITIFDSRIHGLNDITTIFPHVIPSGSTPEGLCYESIMADILNDTKGKVGYFINFSDGEPNISTRSKSPVEIVRSSVAKMKSANIKVLSFFIGSHHYESTFRLMYGKDAKSIDVNSIIPLAKELNKLFFTTK